MNPIILSSILVLTAVGAIFAAVLYFASVKFFVKVDERVAEINSLLPGVNCGACGYPGCVGLAEAIVKAADNKDISHLSCPAGGAKVMLPIAQKLGLDISTAESVIAVVRCGGTPEKAPAKATFDGPASCFVVNQLMAGIKMCPFSCLGYGDCVPVCKFGAISIDPATLIPSIIEEKCTGCGACAKACPRVVIELRRVGERGNRVWVACSNHQKGGVARKNCSVACIGCGKCEKTCATITGAVKVGGNLAYIDYTKCTSCGECVKVCPTGSIKTTLASLPNHNTQSNQGAIS